MTSGELANKASVNKETLRFYERKGLLREPERTDGGYRNYDDGDLQRILFIKNAKSFGFDLKEIAELLAIADGEIIDRVRVRRIARNRVVQIDRQIDSLNRLKTVMGELIYRCSHSGATEECPIIESLAGRANTQGETKGTKE
jgi:MerR family mercuric resistance operon transcriptional regulator